MKMGLGPELHRRYYYKMLHPGDPGLGGISSPGFKGDRGLPGTEGPKGYPSPYITRPGLRGEPGEPVGNSKLY